MADTLTINGVTIPVVEAELHLPLIRGTRLMYLRIKGYKESRVIELTLGEIELPLLASVDGLDRQRVHVRMNGEAYDDDTLGSDIIAMLNNDSTEWTCNMEGVGDGELRMDFRRIEGRRYRCVMEFEWVYFEYEDDDDGNEIDCDRAGYEEPVLCETERASGRAEFSTMIDEVNPLDERD